MQKIQAHANRSVIKLVQLLCQGQAGPQLIGDRGDDWRGQVEGTRSMDGEPVGLIGGRCL